MLTVGAIIGMHSLAVSLHCSSYNNELRGVTGVQQNDRLAMVPPLETVLSGISNIAQRFLPRTIVTNTDQFRTLQQYIFLSINYSTHYVPATGSWTPGH